MNRLIAWNFNDAPSTAIKALALLARVIFLLTLFFFFWNSAMTKFDGFLRLSDGAYYQIFPKAFEAAGYNTGDFPFWRKLVVWFGAISEVILPILLVLGLFTRLASLGMIGFVVVMTWTDIRGHGASLGGVFDSDVASILDVRVYWVFLLIALSVMGGGYLSADKWLEKILR